MSMIFFAFTLAAGAACSGDSEPAGRCRYQSSSSSGGICRVDLACGDRELAASCTDTDCVCIVDDVKTGQRFAADGLCGKPEAEQSQQVEASCALAADAGITADAGGDPGCPPSTHTGMACRAEEVGKTCAGTAACYCTGPVNIATTCTCQEGGAFGRAWSCSDDCQSACAADGGGPADGGGLDKAVKPDAKPAGPACFLAPQCIASTTGSTASLALIASVCGQIGGFSVAACDTDHHDQCVVASQEVVIFTDKNAPYYDLFDSQVACDSVAGVFTP